MCQRPLAVAVLSVRDYCRDLAGHRVHGDLNLEMPRGRLIALLRLREM